MASVRWTAGTRNEQVHVAAGDDATSFALDERWHRLAKGGEERGQRPFHRLLAKRMLIDRGAIADERLDRLRHVRGCVADFGAQ